MSRLQLPMVLTSSPSHFMFIGTMSAAYMYLCDAVNYIYTCFSPKIQVRHADLGSRGEQVREGSRDRAGLEEVCSLGRRRKAKFLL